MGKMSDGLQKAHEIEAIASKYGIPHVGKIGMNQVIDSVPYAIRYCIQKQKTSDKWARSGTALSSAGVAAGLVLGIPAAALMGGIGATVAGPVGLAVFGGATETVVGGAGAATGFFFSKTIVRKGKGFIKYLMGNRGVHRKQAADALLSEGYKAVLWANMTGLSDDEQKLINAAHETLQVFVTHNVLQQVYHRWDANLGDARANCVTLIGEYLKS
ncbi:MAG: hypothetical protein HUN04_20145 [Desulfobacter sp.]|nr:MAG: hypothetical protein HUN04_20145 [Desulfobacter sp.]